MHVVIVGGGQAGLGAAVALAKARPKNVPTEITLIDPKEYFEVRWAAIRAFFDPRIRKSMQTMYGDILPKHNIAHIRGTVTVVNKTSLTLSNGTTVKFDVCLYAVGASCPARGIDPIIPSSYEAAARRTQLAETGEALTGRHALIIGGGALGVELAGELAGHASAVTLVHSGREVVEQMRPSGRHLVHRKLAELAVNVLLGRKATKNSEGAWTAPAKGGANPGGGNAPELVGVKNTMQCTGYIARNAALGAGDLHSALDDSGWALTDAYFRVEGGDGRVFAFGDCCTTGEQNVSTIFSNYSVVAHNMRLSLICLANGRSLHELPEGRMKKAKQPLNLTVLTLGSNTGVADTPLGAMQGVLPPLKNKSMFLSKALAAVS